MLLVYLLIVERGFKTAMLATDSFSKLLATGLTAVLALQVFVIVGGVTKLIPLTGVTLPFISYGGSSIVANFILLALLLLVSDRARREAVAVNAPILKLFALVLVLFGALAAMTSYNSVIKAEDYRDNALNKRPQIEQALVKRGVIRARDGSLLARSVEGDDEHLRRRYSPAALRFSHVLGYDYALTIGRAGLERSRNDALAGEKDELTSIVDDLSGKRKVGDNVITNLDPQRPADRAHALGGRRGSVVAIEPATGKVRVMASVSASPSSGPPHAITCSSATSWARTPSGPTTWATTWASSSTSPPTPWRAMRFPKR